MKKSITQEHPFGCGIACFAFVCNVTYQQAVEFLGPKQANSNRFIIKNLVSELNRFGKPYKAKHINPGGKVNYVDGMIVLLRRSTKYPVGHYLVRYNSGWMDPHINLLQDKQFQNPKSGNRERLPGAAMYVIYPTK